MSKPDTSKVVEVIHSTPISSGNAREVYKDVSWEVKPETATVTITEKN
jgi:hypothetical protein